MGEVQVTGAVRVKVDSLRESCPLAKKGSTLEPLLNGSLADLLRTHGLEAEAEQVIRDRDGRNHQVDVLVELDEHAVAIEAEFAPARTVIADAREAAYRNTRSTGAAFLSPVPLRSSIQRRSERFRKAMPEHSSRRATSWSSRNCFRTKSRQRLACSPTLNPHLTPSEPRLDPL